ncbi:helix-turn-helix domain-containing protein [Actinomadura hibisca]|uniref:helix-turn-helix domain-containing protein n=1 Tax=Actinomadura hibisca TaxID=68565 RepID=UPI00083508C1|nr:helix-turn-helix transcriptional regulator [Actinomadura hibisca]
MLDQDAWDPATIGARLKVLRRWRRLTLNELAGLSGLSKSFLSMAERGQRSLDRRSHIAALARALQVSEIDLCGGPHLSSDVEQSAPHAYVPALRLAVTTNAWHTDPVVERARSVDELVATMAHQIEPPRRRYDFRRVGELLPAVLDELHLHVAQPVDERAEVAALDGLVEAYMAAAGMARSLGYLDLGAMAAMRATEAAARLDDPISQGKAAFSMNRPSVTDLNRVAMLACKAVDRVEPHASQGPDGPETLGMLLLNAALARAATYDVQGAEEFLDAAEELARRLPDDLDANWQGFSATNVGIWRVSIAVESGVPARQVLDLASRVEESKLDGRLGRKACFFADVGRGLARDASRRSEAIEWLRRSERVAPQRFRNDGKIREIVAVMLEQARVSSQGRELRGLAARLSIPH